MVLWFAAGTLVGLLNAGIRWWTVARLGPANARRGLSIALGGLLIRLILAAALLAWGLDRGIVQGLLSFSGIWVARWVALYWIHAQGAERLASAGGRDH